MTAKWSRFGGRAAGTTCSRKHATKVGIKQCNPPASANIEGEGHFKNVANLLSTCGLVAMSKARGAQKELTNLLRGLAEQAVQQRARHVRLTAIQNFEAAFTETSFQRESSVAAIEDIKIKIRIKIKARVRFSLCIFHSNEKFKKHHHHQANNGTPGSPVRDLQELQKVRTQPGGKEKFERPPPLPAAPPTPQPRRDRCARRGSPRAPSPASGCGARRTEPRPLPRGSRRGRRSPGSARDPHGARPRPPPAPPRTSGPRAPVRARPPAARLPASFWTRTASKRAARRGREESGGAPGGHGLRGRGARSEAARAAADLLRGGGAAGRRRGAEPSPRAGAPPSPGPPGRPPDAALSPRGSRRPLGLPPPLRNQLSPGRSAEPAPAPPPRRRAWGRGGGGRSGAPARARGAGAEAAAGARPGQPLWVPASGRGAAGGERAAARARASRGAGDGEAAPRENTIVGAAREPGPRPSPPPSEPSATPAPALRPGLGGAARLGPSERADAGGPPWPRPGTAGLPGGRGDGPVPTKWRSWWWFSPQHGPFLACATARF